jgi:hypothetical protein
MAGLQDGRLTRLLLSALGLAALLYSWNFAWQYFISPAWFDMWFWAADFQKWLAGHYTLHDLVKPHAQHRIVTARLLLLVDSIYFHMSGYFVEVCNLLALLALGVGLGRLAMAGVARNSVWFVPALVWAGFVAATCQRENLMLAFQVPFALSCCAAVGATWLFAAACEPNLARRAALTRAGCGGVAILLAVFSMGSGVLLLPSLIVLLWLRRAPGTVWAVFVVFAAAVLAVEVPGHFSDVAAPWDMPTGFGLMAVRARYSALFLGSIVYALPAIAPWVGYAGYLLVFVLAAGAASRRVRGNPVISASDAALLGLALFAALCGPAASLTLRMAFGPGAALVGRYAGMGLLFWAACAAIVLRMLDRAGPARAWMRGIVVAAVGFLLVAVNLPEYSRSASTFHRDVATTTSLLVNNLYVDGPAPEMMAGIDVVHDTAVFLHHARLNMFAPGLGPPKDILEKLSAAPVGSLPWCRGSVDWAMAIDSGAVMLDGWIADPDARHTAPWIAARDESGRILGTMRSLEERTDLGPALGVKPPAFGFHGGFRDGADGPRRLLLAGIFPDRAIKLCELKEAAEVSGVLVQPIAQLRDIRDAPFVGAAAIGGGFAAGLGGGRRPGRRNSSLSHRFSAWVARQGTLARWIFRWPAAHPMTRR